MHSRTPRRTVTLLGAVVLGALTSPAWSTERGAPARVPPPIAMSPDGEWCLQLSSGQLVAFRGLEPADSNTLGSGGMLYPAPSPVGFIAAVVAHAAIVGGVRAKQAREHAALADKVLEPYQAVLGSFTSQQLEDRTLDARAHEGANKLACGANRTASMWVIDSAPVFFLAQDQTTLVVDNAVALRPPGTPRTNAYRHGVRVVSAHLSADAPAAAWLADDGAKLKAESVELFGQSLDIALRVASGDPVPPDAPFKSFHYPEGGSDKVERAQLVSETCERLLLKTLRATFLSVPTMRSDCAPQSQSPPAEAPAAEAPAAEAPPVEAPPAENKPATHTG